MSDMETLARNLRVLLRTDLIIAEIHLRRLAAKSGYYAVAVLIGGFGLVMLGIAGFLALEQLYGPILAATIVGGVGVVLAALLALVGTQVKPGRELDLANEVHDAAVAAVNADLKTASANVAQVAAFVRNPLDTAMPGLVMQLLGMVLKMFRRRGGGSAS